MARYVPSLSSIYSFEPKIIIVGCDYYRAPADERHKYMFRFDNAKDYVRICIEHPYVIGFKYQDHLHDLLIEDDVTPEHIELLVRLGANVNKICMNLGVTPLLNALLLKRDMEIIKTLIKCGADVHVRDYDGNSVFNYCGDNLKLTKMFIRMGVRMDSVTSIGKTVFDSWTESERERCARFIAKYRCEDLTLIEAYLCNSFLKDDDKLDEILHKKFNYLFSNAFHDDIFNLFNTTKCDDYNNTFRLLREKIGISVFYSVCLGYGKTRRELEDDSEYISFDGHFSKIDTPLKNAIRYRNIKMMKLLLDNGADPCFPDVVRHRPLRLALTKRCVEAVEILFNYMKKEDFERSLFEELIAELNCIYHDFQTELCRFIDRNFYYRGLSFAHECVRLDCWIIFDHLMKIDPNVRDFYGSTVLFYCTSYLTLPNIIKYVDPNIPNNFGSYPIHLVFDDVCAGLILHGASYHLPDKRGNLPWFSRNFLPNESRFLFFLHETRIRKHLLSDVLIYISSFCVGRELNSELKFDLSNYLMETFNLHKDVLRYRD